VDIKCSSELDFRYKNHVEKSSVYILYVCAPKRMLIILFLLFESDVYAVRLKEAVNVNTVAQTDGCYNM
jgi:hypothetical protein